ncbi:MAG: ComEC/Rec2 family competence protein [Acetobacteraceae bacterium]|nr:ComEC/Rec2 family competence protein [Acetobacteraceae bacterium]
MQQSVAIESSGSRAWIGARLGAWAEAERGRFVPWLPVCMMLGVALYFAFRANPPAWSGAAASGLSLVLLALAWRSWPGRVGALALAAASLGFLSAQVATWRALPLTDLPRTATIVRGTVRAVDILPDGRRLVLDGARLGEGDTVARRLRVRVKRGDQTPVVAGDEVQVRALMRPPSGPPYPGGWDLQRDAYFNGLGGGGTALAAITVLDHHPPAGLSAAIQAVRDWIGSRVMAAIPGSPGAIAATFLTGSTLAIPQADRAAMRDSGLAHLLAVAGLHIGIVMGLVFGATRLGLASWERSALFWPTKAIAAVTALAAGGGYMLLAGAHVPVMRSFAMACVVTLGLVVGRRALSLRGWALAALALMSFAPQEVVGVSFQMSFAAVLALISGYEALRPVLMRLYGHQWWRLTISHVVALVLTSLLAGTASAPYGAFHFGHIQLYFIAANVLAVPLTAMWVLPLGLLGLALMPFGLEGLALTPMGWGVQAILAIGRTVSSWPEATTAIRPMPGWGLLVFSLGLAWLALWRTRWRMLGVVPIVAGLLSPAMLSLPDLLVSGDARLIALRVGSQFWLQTHAGGSKFTREEWETHFAAGPFETMRDGAPAACGPDLCQSGPVLLLRSKLPVPEGRCAGVALLVSAEPARGECPSDVALLDRFTVWRDGAAAVWINDGSARVLTDREARGDRPWVPKPPTPRRVQPSLPAAMAEPLPPADND